MAPDTTAPLPPPPSAPPPPPFGRDVRRLRRSTQDRYLGGVAGGLAEHLGLDANVVRIALAVAAIFSLGFVLVAYLAAWLLLPDTIDDEPVALRWYHEHGPSTDHPIATVALLVVAALVASGAWSIATDGPQSGPFPAFLVLGIAALAWATRHDRRASGPAPSDGPGPTGPGPTGPTGSGPASSGPAGPLVDPDDAPTAIEPWVETGLVVADPASAPAPDDPTEPVRRWSDDDGGSPASEPRRARRARRGRRGRPGGDAAAVAERRQHRLVRNFFLLGLAEGGAVTGALWASDWVALPGWTVPATVLGIALVGLATAPLWGWSWTLAGIAVLVLPFLVLAAIPGVTLRGGIGYHHDRPTAVADLPDSYRLGIGHQEVDLTDLDLAPGSRTVVQFDVGIGAADVRVPDDVDLEVRGRIGGGSVFLDQKPIGLEGSDVSFRRRFPAVTAAGERLRDRARLVLDADVGLGALQVERATA